MLLRKLKECAIPVDVHFYDRAKIGLSTYILFGGVFANTSLRQSELIICNSYGDDNSSNCYNEEIQKHPLCFINKVPFYTLSYDRPFLPLTFVQKFSVLVQHSQLQ